MKQKFRDFVEGEDICEVDQFGYVDVNRAFQNGYVPGNNESVTADYNECEDPSAIMGKPSDVFEAMRMQDTIMSNMKSSGYSKDSNAGSSYKKDEH